jgi:hypothetical protein
LVRVSPIDYSQEKQTFMNMCLIMRQNNIANKKELLKTTNRTNNDELKTIIGFSHHEETGITACPSRPIHVFHLRLLTGARASASASLSVLTMINDHIIIHPIPTFSHRANRIQNIESCHCLIGRRERERQTVRHQHKQ